METHDTLNTTRIEAFAKWLAEDSQMKELKSHVVSSLTANSLDSQKKICENDFVGNAISSFLRIMELDGKRFGYHSNRELIDIIKSIIRSDVRMICRSHNETEQGVRQDRGMQHASMHLLSPSKLAFPEIPLHSAILTHLSHEPRKLPDPIKKPTPPQLSTGKPSEHFDAVMATIPKDITFEELVPTLAGLSHEFRQQVAARLEPALNAHIQDRERFPHEDLEGKKKICDFVEKTLEPLGLAVKVPNTPGLPGKLKATTGHWPGVGRFHFEVYVDGKPKRPALSDTLPNLELIDATPVIGPETPWQSHVGPKSSRHGRKLT